MEIVKKKFIIDILMFLDFLAVAISGFVLWLVPKGSGKGVWLFIHDYSSVLLIILLLIHLILNWNWIKAMFKNLGSKNEKIR